MSRGPEADAADGAPPEPTGTRIGLAIGLGAALAATLPVLANGLVWDDIYLISDFDRLGDGHHLGAAITSPFWENSAYMGLPPAPYWRPLTSLCLWLGRAVFGQSSAGFHALSLLSLAAASLAFFVLIRRVLLQQRDRAGAAWVALVFAVHPLGAEVLCMVGNLSDHLAFALIALEIVLFVNVLRGRLDPRFAITAGAILGFLACAAKEIGVVSALSPLAALLLLRAAGTEPLRRSTLPALFAASIVPVAAFVALRVEVLGAEAAFPGIAGLPLAAFMAFGQSLLRAIAPLETGACVSVATRDPVALAPGVIGLGLLAVAAYGAVRIARRPTFQLVGLLVALALLLPSLLTVVPAGGQILIPTRYLHLPLAGLLLAALPAFSRRGHLVQRIAPLAVIMLALLSFVRVREWRDSLSFWTAERDHDPGSMLAAANLAVALVGMRSFDAAEDVLDATEAMPGLSASYRAHASSVRADIARERDHDLERASTFLVKALTLTPNNLDYVLSLADARAAAGRADQAVIVLEKARTAPWFDGRQKAVVTEHLTRFREAAGGKSRTHPASNHVD
ncbi:MAG: hypothetical protein PHU25_00945 [Deltaproteobacteria bacterium]|nr:hypothetical protein [Deltaproteobacteria bacterium]